MKNLESTPSGSIDCQDCVYVKQDAREFNECIDCIKFSKFKKDNLEKGGKDNSEKEEIFIGEIHFDCDTVWKRNFVDNQLLPITDNEELLDFVISYQLPDDYEGCWTTIGEWKKYKSLQYLKWKLLQSGWIIDTKPMKESTIKILNDITKPLKEVIWLKISDSMLGITAISGGYSMSDIDKHITEDEAENLLAVGIYDKLDELNNANYLTDKTIEYMKTIGWVGKDDFWKSNGIVHAHCFERIVI